MEKIIIEAWYKEYFPQVYRRCYKLLRNHEDAENAAQDVFEKLLRVEDSLEIRSSGGPASLLFKIAKNAGIDEFKRRRKEIYMFYAKAINISLKRIKDKGESEIRQLLKNEIAQNNIFCAEINFEDGRFAQVEAEIIVNAILNEEDEKTKLIYFMRYHEDMTFEHIGEAVGLKKSAVEKRLNKFKEHVRLSTSKEFK